MAFDKMIHYVKYVAYTVSLLVILFLVDGCGAIPEYKRECVVWDNVVHALEVNDALNTKCVRNAQCTGFDCMGQYKLFGSMFKAATEETCFGVAIHPCHKPVDLHVYVEVPDKKATFQHDFTNDSMIAIPGVVYKPVPHMTFEGFLFVTMENTNIHGRSYLKIGLTVKVRLTTPISQSWPSSMQVPFMSDEYVPVPPCNSLVVTPNHPLGTCKPQPQPQPDQSSTKPGQTTTTTTTTTTISPYAGSQKRCQVDIFGVCSAHEFCMEIADGLNKQQPPRGVCVCMPNYMLSGSECVRRVTTTTVVPVLSDNVTSTDNVTATQASETPVVAQGKSTKTIIIASSCVVGVIVMAIISLVLILHFRKRRARYGQHELLLNNDDNDDDNGDTDDMT